MAEAGTARDDLVGHASDPHVRLSISCSKSATRGTLGDTKKGGIIAKNCPLDPLLLPTRGYLHGRTVITCRGGKVDLESLCRGSRH